MEVMHEGCIKCLRPDYEPGYITQLCKDCRKELSRFPVKNSIKWAALAVGLLFLVSLYNFPRYFSAGVAYEKAVKAEDQRRYVTEKQLLERVLKQFPDNKEASAHYLIATANNDNLKEADSVLQKLLNANFDDKQLVAKVNDATSTFQYYEVSDTAFSHLLNKLSADTAAYKAALLQHYRQQPQDLGVALVLANICYASGEYSLADTIAAPIAKAHPDCRPALFILSRIYLHDKAYDRLQAISQQLLSQNTESALAFAIEARVLLAQKHYPEALKAANTAHSLAPDGPFCTQSLVLAEHFNGHAQQRDRLYEKLKGLAVDNPTIIQETEAIIK
ncbi:tetratricopeptide repeat protein [Chitinophaga vietnamensis]|uniref:hypothetical protein n=1 Tax=Chitinophaga vietnamensis TaxID=2593957 RepID=UPI0011783937|nr:hypothetical protein [Chitinophaga vietnamensis]